MIGVSRSLMSQLTRHRMASYSIKSQHYVKHKNFSYKMLESPLCRERYEGLMKSINDAYMDMLIEGVPHHIAREVLPNSCLTNIFMTANVREWRHIISLRITDNNTPEIIQMASEVLRQMNDRMPECFSDLYSSHLEDIDRMMEEIKDGQEKV